MKTTTLLLPVVLALPAFAGSSKEVIAPMQTPEPCLYTWFAGGSVGYLTELEEPMYNVHLGVSNTCWNLGGWNTSVFLELGYTTKDDDWSGGFEDISPPILDDSFSIDDLEDGLSDLAAYSGFDTGYDLDIVPITLNAKFERPLTNSLSVYFGAGLGAAYVDLDVDAGPQYGGFSDDDWVFTAQVFAGLGYNVTQNFGIYGGARWIYLDDAEFNADGSDVTLDFDDDYLFELGARFRF